MKKVFYAPVLVLAFALALPTTACSPKYAGIMDMLGGSANLSGITDLLNSAGGLDKVLGNMGDFTMLAPSNEALSKMPADMLANLTNPSNRDQLVETMQKYVVPGKLNTSDLAGMAGNLEGAAGNAMDIQGSGDDMTINGAKVTETLESGNGVIHVIDSLFK